MISHAPSVSIITINLNMASGLSKTIQSVVEQDFADKEYIVIDGGSTDGSLELVHQNASAIQYSLSERDRGIYDAMNKGVRHARGDWILFLNSGDYFFKPDILTRVFQTPIALETDILVGHAVFRFSDGGRRMLRAAQLKRLPYYMICSHQAMLVRRTLLEQRPLSIDKQASDYEYLLKSWCEGRKFQYLDATIAEISAGGVSDRNRFQSLCEHWGFLKDVGLLSFGMRVHLTMLFAAIAISYPLRSILPPQVTSAIRRVKARFIGVDAITV